MIFKPKYIVPEHRWIGWTPTKRLITHIFHVGNYSHYDEDRPLVDYKGAKCALKVKDGKKKKLVTGKLVEDNIDHAFVLADYHYSYIFIPSNRRGVDLLLKLCKSNDSK